MASNEFDKAIQSNIIRRKQDAMFLDIEIKILVVDDD